jgi:type IV pilus assembly protein PilB
MIDMGAESFLLVSTIKTIIGQRLVRKLTNTKEKYFLNPTEIAALAKIIDLDRMLTMIKTENIVPQDATWETIPFYKAVPSEESESGYSGRLGIHEVLKVTTSIKELILKGASEDVISDQAKKEGMMTMLEDGLYMAVSGLTTTEEVLRVVSE